jgi:hypothetical protein
MILFFPGRCAGTKSLLNLSNLVVTGAIMRRHRLSAAYADELGTRARVLFLSEKALL